jgi:hypothetical protein
VSPADRARPASPDAPNCWIDNGNGEHAEEGEETKKVPAGRPRIEFASYVLKIEEWEWSFSFGVNEMRNTEGPYSDFRHPHLRGDLVRRTRIEAEKVELTILPDHDLNEDKREGHEPKTVGSLEFHSGRLIVLLSCPRMSCPPFCK